MDELYVPIFSRRGDSSVFSAPLDSLVALFTVRHCRGGSRLTLVLVPCDARQRPQYPVDLAAVGFTLLDSAAAAPPMARACRLPAVLTADGATCVAGLCAVLRHVVKVAHLSHHRLLGFRRGCLMACAEVSLWTRFCEVDIMKSVDALAGEGISEVPGDVVRFEFHLNQPLRVHNVQKTRQELAKTRVVGEEIVEHAFAEGPCMTLSDLILLPCFYIILRTVGSVKMKECIPLTMAWFNKMMDQEGISETVLLLNHIDFKVEEEREYTVPTVAVQSLYKSDPKRYKPASRIFTKQADIDTSLAIVSGLGLAAPWLERPPGWDAPLDWSAIPLEAHPEGGHLPPSRLDRKRAQLECLARAAMTVAKPGDLIVDFCSGGGHLGLLLAVLLPSCRVLLLENKHESLDRARARGSKLSLGNVSYMQSNLGYYVGSFDVGVALHACGTAADLVMEMCVSRGAAYVVCPCCYGGVQASHAGGYPRSAALRASSLSVRDYLVLGHAADQTHYAAHAKTAQGNQCMAVIDADRCLAARERGYRVSMAKLEPQTCSPKNNLLVGVPGCVSVGS